MKSSPQFWDITKILWILKEPYDEDDGTGGGWSFPLHVLGIDDVYEKIGSSPTFQPIIYVSFSLLNEFVSWKEMDYIRDAPEMAKILHQVAYINIQKLPRFKQSDNGLIYQAYQKYRDLIWEQIETFSPDIVIGCNPHMSAIMHDAGIEEIENHKSVDYGCKGNRLYINAYHPSQRSISRESYVNDIVDIVKMVKNNDIPATP
jgi:hypothetical protein